MSVVTVASRRRPRCVLARTNLAGAKDIYLLHLAEAEERIVLTLDKDFWQIAVQL